jgi:hypothetical protein
MLLPSLSRAATLGERLRMQSLATRLVVALRLFANEHDGEAPGRLAELQEYVPADDLIDPFSGKPFVYKQNGPAWMIYSVSEDGVDDGGEQEEGDNFRPDHVRRFPPTKVEPFAPAAEE